jgi:TolA-binding protein
MRFHLLGLLLLAGLAVPAPAQRAEPVERRVDRLEQELRAVQRRVFPNGRAQFVEPEIGAPRDIPQAAGQPSGDALASLAARADAMEAQLRTLTGQVEEQGFRTRQLEEQVARLRTDLQGRLDRLEQPAREPAAPARPPSSAAPAAPSQTETSTAPARTAADAAEEAYNVGFRLWDAHQYAQAQQALAAAAARYPNSRWTSWIRNLQGRAYLDDGKPATAARILLANYQDNPRGDRAADSLYYLGQALNRLNRRAEACRVYDELAQVYPDMRDVLRQRLPQARADARCGAAAAPSSR